MSWRTLAAPLVLVRAWLRGRRESSRIYAADYDRRAATYDATTGRAEMGAVSERLLDRLDASDPRRILDLGCGTGHGTERLATRFPDARIDAVDLSQAMLARARDRCAAFPNVTFHKADMEAFVGASPERTYDLATCLWAIGYARPARVLARLSNALVPGGQLAVVVNTRRSLVEIQDVYGAILIQHPNWLGRVPRIGFPHSGRQFLRWARRARLTVEHFAESQIALAFADGQEFVVWLQQAGQSAGLEEAIRPECRQAVWDEVARHVGDAPFHATHRFVEFVGVRR